MGQQIVPDLDRFTPACGPLRLESGVIKESPGKPVIFLECAISSMLTIRPSTAMEALTAHALEMESDTDWDSD